MNNLFLALLLLSLLGLVVGLINPSLFRLKSRTQSGGIFAAATIIFFVLFGVTNGSANSTPVTTVVPANEAASSAPAVVTTKTTTAPATPAPSAPAAPAKQTTNTAVATPAPQPAPAAQPTVLVQLKGSGTKSSQTFTAPSNWTLSYTYDCSNFDGDSGNFQVFVQSADGGFNDLSPVNELGASGSDTEYYHSGGQYYLEVNSECDWTVTAKG
jgi:uncharacterized iron-regulated membrane protein